jgi:hypothetical protein
MKKQALSRSIMPEQFKRLDSNGDIEVVTWQPKQKGRKKKNAAPKKPKVSE